MDAKQDVIFRCREMGERVLDSNNESIGKFEAIKTLNEQCNELCLEIGFYGGPIQVKSDEQRPWRPLLTLFEPEERDRRFRHLERRAIICKGVYSLDGQSVGTMTVNWNEVAALLARWERYVDSVKEINSELSPTEHNVIQALKEWTGDKGPTGEDLAERAGYNCSGSFKGILSAMKKSGYIESSRKSGYSLTDKGLKVKC